MNLLERAYELYKIVWIEDHISLEDLLQSKLEYFEYVDECVEIGDQFDSYDDWIFENGYHGMLYVSIEEFEEYEFKNEMFMELLLGETYFKKWKELMANESSDNARTVCKPNP